MPVTGKADLHQVALAALAGPTGEVLGPDALAAAAARTYADLVRVSAPLIGHAGVSALTGRAVHLAQREHPLLGRHGEPPGAERTFDDVMACLKGQDPAAATDAAAAVFTSFFGLLVDFIGEPLTASLLRKAWPHAVAYASR
ncbi:MAG: hypothetical protein Q8O42_18145 [Acidobacteriota bacterium]|nr:hypothetical protein [Acidobacteriota bacterium]